MTNLQAALGIAQLELLDKFIKIKRDNFKKYINALDGYKGLSFIKEPEYGHSNCWYYSLIVDEDRYGLSRDQLMDKLSGKKIQTRPLWYPNHLQKPYINSQTYEIDKAKWFYERILNIPCSVGLKQEEIDTVIHHIKN